MKTQNAFQNAAPSEGQLSQKWSGWESCDTDGEAQGFSNREVSGSNL